MALQQSFEWSQFGTRTWHSSRWATCAGVKWGEIGNKWSCPYCRTCRFDNVCLNHTSLAIQFYQDPQDSIPLFYDFIGQPHNSFPADFINTGRLDSLAVPSHPSACR